MTEIDLTQSFVLPKYLFIGEPISELFSIKNFGKKAGGLYWTYIALKMISLQYGNPDNDFWFYRSAKEIGRIARLSEKPIQHYVQVLIRLGLILAIKNPGPDDYMRNPGLVRLVHDKFKKLPNKPIYFFRISNLSNEAIEKATPKAKEVDNWFNDKYQTGLRAKRDRELRKMEKAFNLPKIPRKSTKNNLLTG